MQHGFVFPPLRRWRYALRAHWPVWLGMAMTLAALAVAAISLPELATAHTALLDKARALQNAEQDSAVAAAPLAQPLSARLAPLSTLALVTADMQALAQQNQLQIATASYQPANDPVLSDVVRVDISATLRGAYLPTKKLLADMLATHPSLALQSMALRRERSTDAVLEVETHWILFCREPS
jgi:hypothetical protein